MGLKSSSLNMKRKKVNFMAIVWMGKSRSNLGVPKCLKLSGGRI